MTIIEKYYITYKHDGHLTDRIYHQNYSYFDLEEEEENLASKFSEPGTSVRDRSYLMYKTMVGINIPYMKQALSDIVVPMANIDISDVEIVGLMLIMLFDPSKFQYEIQRYMDMYVIGCFFRFARFN